MNVVRCDESRTTEQRIGMFVRVADLVDSLEDEDRVVHPGLAQALDYTAGGAAVRSADLPLGRLPVQRHAHRRSAEGLGDGVRERRLAGPRRGRPGREPKPAPEPVPCGRPAWATRPSPRAGTNTDPRRSAGRAPGGTSPRNRRMPALTPSSAAWVRPSTCAT